MQMITSNQDGRGYWHVDVEWTCDDPPNQGIEAAGALIDALVEGGLDGPAVGAPLEPMHRWSVTVSLARPGAAEAVAVVAALLPGALEDAGFHAARVVQVGVWDPPGFLHMLSEPLLPDLIDLRGIADRYGFSRQRAHELSRIPGRLPEPVGPGPVFVLRDVERVMARPPRRPGPAALG